MAHDFTRRGLLMAGGASVVTAGCTTVSGSERRGAKIDQRVDAALAFLYEAYPGTRDLDYKASGVLVMPLVTEAGFGFGAGYGRGALRVGGATVDYYNAISGSFGFQIGAQQYSHALFFMTDEALQRFRNSAGWSVGGDVEYAVIDNAGNLGVDTNTLLSPVVALIFGQAGLIAGATLEGTKYTRVFP